jgi:hypothetical protein
MIYWLTHKKSPTLLPKLQRIVTQNFPKNFPGIWKDFLLPDRLPSDCKLCQDERDSESTSQLAVSDSDREPTPGLGPDTLALARQRLSRNYGALEGRNSYGAVESLTTEVTRRRQHLTPGSNLAPASQEWVLIQFEAGRSEFKLGL